MNYIIYHPRRVKTKFEGLTVYHDSFKNNQDPYIWNKQFLHSFCHITQISPIIESKIFWVSGEIYPDFNKLYCDCVFTVQEKIYWDNSNHIEISNRIVENEQTFKHHYMWVNPPHSEHYFKRRRRFTLKADSEKSFQAQNNKQCLIDIVPFLNEEGISINELRSQICLNKKGERTRNSKPIVISQDVADKLFKKLSNSDIIIKGEMIEKLHPER